VLQPFIFWDRCTKHPDHEYGHCYLFDRAERGTDEFLFKAVGHTCTVDVAADPRYALIAQSLGAWRERDGTTELIRIGTLTELSVD
jgi:hypothetical protein